MTEIMVGLSNDVQWDPPSLEEVTKEMVDFYVSPLISEPELELPTASREPSV